MSIKNFLFIPVILGFLFTSSCQQGGLSSKKINLSTKADSASYALGILIAQGQKQNLDNAPGKEQINIDIMAESFRLFLKDEEQPMTAETANSCVSSFFQEMYDKQGQENLEKGNSFLEENRKRENVTTTASGLQYEIIKEGTGPKPLLTDRVKVHYHGTLINGEVFDSSVERNEPAEFGLDGVIPGWTEVLQLMPVGSKWKIYLPAELGYGERGAGGSIGPNTTLIFEVELLDILKSDPAQ